ncbi:disulfide bond formation protein B [Pseudomonas rubra]|uniref:Disulfide bond formation protein B n=1 Tax=Pseudomonas rubra TaxID=2942627 RepID=A0ABT5P2H8_9PSED|nr:disulfide bond formation protein B [Pseudomonas rubra]MDD1012476.1 disulfide bond formation protein B [Pseudomonas rubra]MDD1037177.1 disulfide bond formation protein B [Pseudomonas rubra]MDD1152894.1 disulfide bond formation protein B [Pseudomonas rubra]
MSRARLRSLFFPALLASVLVQAAAYYLEFGMGLVPCPLCYSQRLFLGAFALVCLCAVVHSPGRLGTRIYAALALFFATGGALLAARHVWLQGNSALAGIECEPAFDYVIENMPVLQVIQAMLVGSPDCVPINWSFLDLTIPEWSLLSFVLLAALPTFRLLGRGGLLFHRAVKS